jgi:hypothetical protein
MVLIRVNTARLADDVRTFECFNCDNVDKVMVETKRDRRLIRFHICDGSYLSVTCERLARCYNHRGYLSPTGKLSILLSFLVLWAVLRLPIYLGFVIQNGI